VIRLWNELRAVGAQLLLCIGAGIAPEAEAEECDHRWLFRPHAEVPGWQCVACGVSALRVRESENRMRPGATVTTAAATANGR
jgi:hypothetical protein